MSLFDNARSVVMNNKVVDSIKTSDGGVIYEKTDDTYLTIDVPLSLIYSDAFSITGALTDYYGNGLSGKIVDLLVGSTVVDSTTTTTNGAYSFTNTPVRTGNHEFKVVFNGDSSYDSSESVTVSRVVGKETSVIINQTNMNKTKFKPQDGNSYFEIIPKCKLVTDDNEVIANADIVVNGRTTITTNGNGEGLLAMAYSENVSFTYNGDDNYAPCSLTISMPRQIPTVIQVTGDSVIQKEESTTLTVTVLDQDGDVIPNCTLSYSAKHGSTDVASGTLARTNNNGQATVSYTGTGIGDVDFTFTYNANGTLLQETYEVQDCYLYDDATIDKSSNYNKTSYLTVTHNTDHYTLNPSMDNQFMTLVDGYDNIEASVKIQPTATNALNGLTLAERQDSYSNNVSLELSTNRILFFTMDNGSFNSRNEVTKALGSNWYNVVLKVEGSNVTYTVYDSSDNQVYTYSYTKSISNKYVNVALSTMNNLNIKDIKIKAL